jgi:hypothetical protein
MIVALDNLSIGAYRDYNSLCQCGHCISFFGYGRLITVSCHLPALLARRLDYYVALYSPL